MQSVWQGNIFESLVRQEHFLYFFFLLFFSFVIQTRNLSLHSIMMLLIIYFYFIIFIIIFFITSVHDSILSESTVDSKLALINHRHCLSEANDKFEQGDYEKVISLLAPVFLDQDRLHLLLEPSLEATRAYLETAPFSKRYQLMNLLAQVKINSTKKKGKGNTIFTTIVIV